MTEQIDCVVIGAGVVGLAVARELALAGREVVVLEAANSIGTGTSSRNSEVIHAGIYYPPGSLKARLCVAGKRLLYGYCDSHQVPHRRCGKLIVATSAAQVAALQAMRAKAAANGVDGDEALQPLTREQARALEPELSCTAALLSPSTGILDSHAYMLALQGDAEAAGAMIAFAAPVQGGELSADGLLLDVGGSEPGRWRVNTLVNCAGLGAQQLATSLRGFPAELVPPSFYAKGNYFTLSGRAHFSRLIYPVPEAAGLGVHLTLDLQGQARFGPDVEWVETPHYPVDPRRADTFYAEVRKYWPGLPDGALQPDYAGIRPKLGGPGEAAADFRIDGPALHGVPGLVNLFGIESPGLTASLAIARHVAGLLDAA
ncbi:MAG TPA: NAD(P)/FAD-dependent oxidoreductase [Ideonella sp.]|nr:NAD(P)/FAD-dependent oxidoreductase [Ideonella sp.]